jgi:hypothetical protein
MTAVCPRMTQAIMKPVILVLQYFLKLTFFIFVPPTFLINIAATYQVKKLQSENAKLELLLENQNRLEYLGTLAKGFLI